MPPPASAAEIRDTNRKVLSSMKTVRKLGGTLDDAIRQQEAAMEPEDVKLVTDRIEEK
ncbi:MAG: hypothetical protein FWD35_02175 [Oscillospiraceae bacterium]|nr:hypothetical protein [Oscillospiraceae bacterium]